jgi:hypothetical protein
MENSSVSNMDVNYSISSFAEVLPPNVREPFDNLGDLRGAFQPVFKVAQQRGCIGTGDSIVHPVVNPQSLSSRIQETCCLKDPDMLGDGRLRNPQCLLNLANTEFSVLKHLDDFDSIRIPQGFHDLNEVLHWRFSSLPIGCNRF